MARNKIYRTVSTTTCKGEVTYQKDGRYVKDAFEQVFNAELTREQAQAQCAKLNLGKIVTITEYAVESATYSMLVSDFMAAAKLEEAPQADEPTK